MVTVTSLEKADFCSKTVFRHGGEYKVIPDIRKAFMAKTYYRGENVEIHNQPRIHAMAKYLTYRNLSPAVEALLHDIVLTMPVTGLSLKEEEAAAIIV